jgi:hypothetical protein
VIFLLAAGWGRNRSAVTQERGATPAKAGAQLGDEDGDAQPVITTTFPTGPRPPPGWCHRIGVRSATLPPAARQNSRIDRRRRPRQRIDIDKRPPSDADRLHAHASPRPHRRHDRAIARRITSPRIKAVRHQRESPLADRQRHPRRPIPLATKPHMQGRAQTPLRPRRNAGKPRSTPPRHHRPSNRVTPRRTRIAKRTPPLVNADRVTRRRRSSNR